MATFPLARRQEYLGLFDTFPLTDGERIADLPAIGGGLAQAVLTRTLKVSVIGCSYEPLENSCQVAPLERWPFPPVDRLVSVAALHHEPNLEEFLQTARLNIRTGGWVQIADVAPNSKEAHFLEEQVHDTPGLYRSYLDLPCLERVVRATPWRFDTLGQLTWFCSRLFGLGLDHHRTLELLDNYDLVHAHSCSLDWNLLYVTFEV